MQFYASPEAERVALRRAAARAGAHITELVVARATFGAPARVTSVIECQDGWAAARLLLALAAEDARTPGAKRLAAELRERTGGDDEAFARAIQAFVKAHVAFENEQGERFESGGFTLDLGKGDCDAHFRLAFAIAEAGGLHAALGILHHGRNAPPDKQGPAHAAMVYRFGDAWLWGETTVDADFGEPPNDAARRLGVTDERTDIAREVVIMTEDQLPPIPEGFRERNNAAQVLLDAQALQRLGYLEADAPACMLVDPTSTVLRLAVLRFQAAQHLVRDGLLGPTTRITIAHALRDAGPPVTEGFDYPGLAGLLGDVTAPATAPVAKASARVPDEFLREVGALIRRWRAKGAGVTGLDLLGVLNSESGVQSNIQARFVDKNGKRAQCFGLNQLCSCENDKNPGVYPCFRAVGFMGTPTEYLALSLVEQLPFVARYFENAVGGNMAKLRDAQSLYLANLAPAFMAHADDPDFKIYVAPDGRYTSNAGVDVDHDGAIEVRELVVFIERGKNADRKFWDELEARYRVLGDEPPKGSSGSTATVVASVLVTLAAAGGLAYWALRT